MKTLFSTYPGLVTAFGAFVLWILTRWAELVRDFFSKRRAKNNLIRALFAEVDFNTRDLEFFTMNSADISKITAAMAKDPDLLPHVTDTHHTKIYAENLKNMHLMDDDLVARLVLFYGLLEKIKTQIDGVNLPSFATVSSAGKSTIIQRLGVQVTQCEAEGRTILDRFTKRHSKLALVRHTRQAIETKQQ